MKLYEELARFLHELETIFSYSTMAANFKGHHSVTLVEGKLVVSIWYHGRIYPVIDDGQPPLLGSAEWLPAVAAHVEAQRQKYLASQSAAGQE